jgi:hypothetical protein
VHRLCFLNAFTWDTIIAYKNMYGGINSGKLWSLMGRGCHLGTPSRNVLSMYCFFAISHLNRIIFYSLIIMRNIGGKTIVLILNGCNGFTRWTLMMCNMWTRAGYFCVLSTCGKLPVLWKNVFHKYMIFVVPKRYLHKKSYKWLE